MIPPEEEELWKHVGGRSGEAAFAVATANGRVLLQRKRHYPADVYRLPTGRLQPGETAEAALRREVLEETGLVVRRTRDLAVIRFHVDYGGRTSGFETRLFAVETFPGTLSPLDRSEGIVGYLAVSIGQLPGHWRRLRNLPAPLHAWGRFRAAPLAALWSVFRRGRFAA
ncbi:MAG: NUDIX hydrolase [Nitrospirota bacterium]